MNQRRRVVITGIGVTSPLGNSPDEMYASLKAGRCSIREISEWEIDNWKDSHFFGSPVTLPPDYAKTLPRSIRRSMSSISLYAAYAAQQAVSDSGLPPEEVAGGRCGCIVGSTMGGSSAIEEAYRIFISGKGMEEMSSMQFFKCVSHTAAFNVSHLFNVTGVVQSPAAACASAVQAIGQGRDLIGSGVQDMAICGGAEELAPEVSGSFEVIFAGVKRADRDPKTCSRPFDVARTGLVCGEGAGIVVLEEYEHAVSRGAKIYAEILGYATCGCGNQISQSDHLSILRCFDLIYKDAGVEPSGTDYINAHATATVQGDMEEAIAIREFFGGNVPVSSLKGHMGHTLGASGSLELIAALKMMEHSELIPTLNLENPSEECSGIFHVRERMPHDMKVFLKNSFAFGGINAGLLCAKAG
ncbi:MAG: 3-oxoacyl-(acyl-carrier-protein) synthase 1 [Lentisphaerae bacterium ADurb.Bin242]|nr:MAG: 3-oxoacyl-(acyl-carrier-protein) synthase 1 [Lentisphaerae bacterium ADurb.Bin242]